MSHVLLFTFLFTFINSFFNRCEPGILGQMAKEKHENVHSTFRIYYDSCVQYERTVNFNERVEMGN